MAKKLFVGNLPYTVTSDDLKDLFGKAGSVVTADVVTDKFSGRSRGFGFVEMSSDEETDKAIEMLNGSNLEERALIVNEARPMGERSERKSFGGPRRFGGGDRGDRPRRPYDNRRNF